MCQAIPHNGGFRGEDFSFGGRGEGEEDQRDHKEGGETGLNNKLGAISTSDQHPKATEAADAGVGKHMPPASVMTRLILIMVWRKLIRNPNTYSSLIGLVWSLIAFR